MSLVRSLNRTYKYTLKYILFNKKGSYILIKTSPSFKKIRKFIVLLTNKLLKNEVFFF